MTKNKKHLVIGKGEVGMALYLLLKKKYPVSMRDKDDVLEGKFDVLHITYPSIKDFVRITKRYIKEYDPELVIIHSTIAVGTTRKVGKIAVHSPIRGMHTPGHHKGIKRAKKPSQSGNPEYFGKSMKAFVKYFSGPKARNASRIFSKIGFKTKSLGKSETTELLKILDTTYYGWNILFMRENVRLCEKYKVDFDVVYTDANRSYNEGYKKLGMSHVIRPVLKYIPGKLGGHCVVPNTELLKDWLTETVKKRNQTYK